jgi:hypothetical protein
LEVDAQALQAALQKRRAPQLRDVRQVRLPQNGFPKVVVVFAQNVRVMPVASRLERWVALASESGE